MYTSRQKNYLPVLTLLVLTRIYFIRIAALGDVRVSRDIRNSDYDEIQIAHRSSSDP